MIPDVLAALIAHVKESSELTALVSSRVWGAWLPQVENGSMPRKCIVLRESGGMSISNNVPIGGSRIDVRCFGETPYEAGKVFRALLPAMKFDLQRIAYGDTLLHSAVMESGPIQMTEPDTTPLWNIVMSTWIVRFAETAIA